MLRRRALEPYLRRASRGPRGAIPFGARGFAIASGPTDDTWIRFQRRWARLRPPLRPHAAVADAIAALVSDRAERVMLLGVTPELADTGRDLTAYDWSSPMLRSIWPGDSATRRAKRANWLALPDDARDFSAVIGDGSLNVLARADYPALYRQLALALRPRARIAIRVFATPSPGETLSDVKAAAMGGEIAGVHAFKWRLAMAVAARSSSRDVALADAHAAFELTFPDRKALSAATGWSLAEIAEIDDYRGSPTLYSFPTRDDLLESTPPAFSNPRFHHCGGYELAERCPIFLADFTP